MIQQPSADVTGYVLAGGRSKRMGQDKAFLTTDGKPLVEHAVSTLQSIGVQVKILSGPPDFERDALLSCYAHLVHDADPTYAGPLAGLAAALADCPTEYALLLPVDQPALPAEALQGLIAVTTSGAPAAHFQNGERAEPLPLLASRTLLPAIQAALHNRERRLLPTVRYSAACFGTGLQTVVPGDPAQAHAWFRNLNTPEDLHNWLEPAQRSNQSGPPASE